MNIIDIEEIIDAGNIEDFITTKDIDAGSKTINKGSAKEKTISWPARDGLRVVSIKAFIPDVPEFVAYCFDEQIKQHAVSDLYRNAEGDCGVILDRDKKAWYMPKIDAFIPNMHYSVQRKGSGGNSRISKAIDFIDNQVALSIADGSKKSFEQVLAEMPFTNSDKKKIREMKEEQNTEETAK